MVEILEKCIVIGIGLILASALFPTQYNLIKKTGELINGQYYYRYFKEIDDTIKKTYNLGQDASLNMILSKDTFIKYEDNCLKIIMHKDTFDVGKYTFQIRIDDQRILGGETVIRFTRQNDYLLMVIKDA